MQSSRKISQVLGAILFALACVFSVHAQATTGSVRGVVTDQNGAIVPGAKVTLSKKGTGVASTTQTSDTGAFEFTNIQVGEDYSVKVEAANFKTTELTDVRVSLNQATDLPVSLAPGAVSETVTVTAGGTELVDTTTTNLSKAFSSRQVVELAQTTAGPAGSAAGVNNLALLAPGVTSSGGVGVGTGGSVGGQRPRDNNFVLDGVDNNDKAVTGPQSYISPEEVAEFSLLQNQFSAEFGRSNGGNFITVTKSGTNDFHGTFYGFVRNRYLNALDTLQKNAGVTRNKADGDLFMPRSDFFRGGANLGGPVFFPRFGEGGPSLWKLRDKLFFFTSYERLQSGSAAGAAGIVTPTAAGMALLGTIPGLSANNLNVFRTYTPVAPVNNEGTIDVLGRLIPVGDVSFSAPQFYKQNHAVINLDWNQSGATQHHFRFSMTNGADIDNFANLPIFFTPLP
ncbi:MAG TPA: carboxypeptidase-like regulatory domain-containing protein, partial [Pyrinomonadaceae bacterium]|nr:carboxypeptidase-like regulatory domain-containing protein [Pyrinomonadaceae bacterium]